MPLGSQRSPVRREGGNSKGLPETCGFSPPVDWPYRGGRSSHPQRPHVNRFALRGTSRWEAMESRQACGCRGRSRPLVGCVSLERMVTSMRVISIPTLIFEADPEVTPVVDRASHICLVPMGDELAFTTALTAGVPAGYIVGRQLDAGLKALINRVLLSVPDGHLLVRVQAMQFVEGAAPVVGNRVTIAGPWLDQARVEVRLSNVWVAARVEGTRRRVESRDFHWLVRKAFYTVLSGRLPRCGRVASSGNTLVKNLLDLGERCGARPDTFRQHRSRADVDLRKFIVTWKMLLAVREHLLGREHERTPWAEVSRRLGYSDESGVRHLLARNLRISLKDVGFWDLQQLCDQLDALICED